MSGWLVAIPYEVHAGLVTHEALFAVWHPDRDEALALAKAYDPQASQIQPRPVGELRESMLRGLKLKPGEAGLLHADQPRI